MIFTVGHTESYERYMDTDERPEKLGKGLDHSGQPYGGGCVFESVAAATSYLSAAGKIGSYSVYGLVAEMADSEQLPGEPYRRLLRDARIVRVDQNAGNSGRKVA